jgi:hypothetical protein
MTASGEVAKSTQSRKYRLEATSVAIFKPSELRSGVYLQINRTDESLTHIMIMALSFAPRLRVRSLNNFSLH